MNKIKHLFLKDPFILTLIVLNALLIFIEESFPAIQWFDYVENLFTLVFIIEIIIKIRHYGIGTYLSGTWNRLDFILVLLSIPSLATLFYDHQLMHINVLLTFRIFRVFKAFRLFKFLPNADSFIVSVKRALNASYIVLVGFFILIFIVALITTTMYKDVAPEYFGSPIHSFYTIFQIFSIEGWYEIPNHIAEKSSNLVAFMTKLYFSVLLFVGGILGFSLVNSIFVDAMVSDNNDDLEEKVAQLREEIQSLNSKIDFLIEEKKKDNF
ncbi:MAG: ion transporter [Bacteroidia bacterium]|nr:ion transporter [Bacteroidia bacterium]